MIVGLGIDLVETPRIRRAYERFGPAFARKILHERELAALPANPVDFLASRFAAKEAAVKALGTGFRGIWFQDLYVEKLENGQPGLVLLGPALERFHALQAKRVLLSLTHGRNTAAAVVILEK